MEIERKFLVSGLNPEELEEYLPLVIEQHYLANCLGVRIRRKGDCFTLTIKGPGAPARIEVEKEISAEEFSLLLSLCDRGLRKTRYSVGSWQIDVFKDSLSGLILAEVELKEEDEEVEPFPFAGVRLKEVTHDPNFTNQNLSQENIKIKSNVRYRQGRKGKRKKK